jgi:predicted nucleic acid-binding protein
MPLLISDANIFIDFEEGGILESLFELDDTIGVPDLLFVEELQEQHAHLLDLGLKLMELASETVQRVVGLAGIYRKPSRLDLAALALAEQESCPLLTGDMELRVAAEKEGVEVRGTLWICERLVQENVMTVSQLEVAYQRMKTAKRRLPWDKVKDQIRRFRKGR